MTTLRENMSLVASNEGVWEGTYSFISPRGWINDRYDFKIILTIYDDPNRSYRQESYYTWADGKTEERVFEAGYDLEENQMTWDDGRIAGHLWEIDETSFHLRFGFSAMPDVQCFETVQMFDGGAKRGRTWLWYRNGELYQYVLIDERRTA
ncbi:MAG: DUF3598 family protein [Rhodospirillaceae bacterium]